MNDQRHHSMGRKKARAAALVIPIVLGISIWDAFAADTNPPSAIGDLRLSAPSKAPQLHMVLTWTAPDDVLDGGGHGAAKSNDIRYSTSIINNSNFASAARANVRTLTGTVAAPSAPGSVQTVEILGLTPNTTYYFAIKTSDSAGNVSPLSNVASQSTPKYEGYGYATVGGGTVGGNICRVTNLQDYIGTPISGSLRNCLSTPRPLTIVFNVGTGGDINLLADILLDGAYSNLTIDGSTAASPGITFRKPACAPSMTSCPVEVTGSCIAVGEFMVGSDNASATHDVILTHLRWQGNYGYHWGDCADNSSATLGLQYNFYNIVVDHATIRNSEDAGPDMWTGDSDSHDVTLSNSIMAWSNHPLLLKGTGESGAKGSRDNVSIYRNVLARSGQRMPAIVSRSTDVDVRNNIIYDWASDWTARTGGDGMQVTQQGNFAPSINIVNNYFKAGNNGTRHPQLALYYGARDGNDNEDGGSGHVPGTCPPQGSVYTGTLLGEMWVAGNILPSQNCDQWSSVTSERSVPSAAAVTTLAASALTASVLPDVGTQYRTADEDALMTEIAVAMGCGNGTRGTGELCDGADLGGKKCQDLGYSGGTLSCTSLCTFNTGGCTGGSSGQSPSQVSNLRRQDIRP